MGDVIHGRSNEISQLLYGKRMGISAQFQCWCIHILYSLFVFVGVADMTWLKIYSLKTLPYRIRSVAGPK
jgi:hypothetical protein